MKSKALDTEKRFLILPGSENIYFDEFLMIILKNWKIQKFWKIQNFEKSKNLKILKNPKIQNFEKSKISKFFEKFEKSKFLNF